jgi:hypothetical protein
VTGEKVGGVFCSRDKHTFRVRRPPGSRSVRSLRNMNGAASLPCRPRFPRPPCSECSLTGIRIVGAEGLDRLPHEREPASGRASLLVCWRPPRPPRPRRGRGAVMGWRWSRTLWLGRHRVGHRLWSRAGPSRAGMRITIGTSVRATTSADSRSLASLQVPGPAHGAGLGRHPVGRHDGVTLGQQVVAGVSVGDVDDVASLAHLVEIGAQHDSHLRLHLVSATPSLVGATLDRRRRLRSTSATGDVGRLAAGQPRVDGAAAAGPFDPGRAR